MEKNFISKNHFCSVIPDIKQIRLSIHNFETSKI